jgi:DNA-directed RNA polymerase subunit H (RpoH/RPB5)
MDRVEPLVEKTVIEMMTDRGYTITKKMLDPELTRETLIACTEVEKCYIFISTNAKMGIGEFRKYREIMDLDNIKHIIIVINQGLTSFTTGELSQIDEREAEIEVFYYKHLVGNPTRHKLYRVHRPLSEKEKSEFLKKCRAKEENLSKLYRDDRICQYFNFPVGTIVEITRTLGTLGPYKYYRIVVPVPP